MENTYSTEHYEQFADTKDVNLFEEIIDNIVMDGLDEAFREMISGLDRKKKRIAILKLLGESLGDNDRRVRFDQLKGLFDKGVDRVEHIQEVIGKLREYVKVAGVKKKEFGEVMTPLELVDEMISHLPEEVWSNPDLKWLDPANGTGPFPMGVVSRLMKGLENWEPDAEKRYRHIVENMIYVCELQPKNMFLYMCLMDPFDEYRLNIYTGSFLEKGFDDHMENVWGLGNFDVVLGNPPYQDNTGNVGSGHTLWNKFVLKSLNILVEGGYLSMVHPSGWRNISGSFEKVKIEILKRNIQYLEIHNINDGLKTFGAATRYDFYCLKNSNDYVSTEILDEDGNVNNINISKLKFIPNKKFDDFIKLTKHDEPKVNIIYSRSMYGADKKNVQLEKNNEFKYPCVKYISKVNGDIDFRYSNENKGMFGIPKVMFGIGSQVGGIIIDKNGEYGLCQFVAGICDSTENLEYIQMALKSEKFKELMKSCQFTTQMYNHKIIGEFRKDFWKEFI
jgi:hypothetical protein